MRNTISYTAALTALGLAIAGPTAANAQTVIPDQPVETVITQQPVQTIQTTETVRTVRPGARPIVRKRVVTTTRQTVVSQRAVAAQPLYDVVPPAPLATRTYAPPLYDTLRRHSMTPSRRFRPWTIPTSMRYRPARRFRSIAMSTSPTASWWSIR